LGTATPATTATAAATTKENAAYEAPPDPKNHTLKKANSQNVFKTGAAKHSR